MAKYSSWGKAITTVLKDPCAYVHKNTVQTYKDLKEQFGLETVLWQEFTIMNPSEKMSSLKKAASFLEKNHPCLFIYDPLSQNDGLRKGFLFGVERFEEIQAWIASNENSLGKYSYLITTQIASVENGFVGNCFSDGKGNMLVETLHKPGISNQRALSQPQNEISTYLDWMAASNFRILGTRGTFLTPAHAHTIISAYGDKNGYFEFVVGIQNGKKGLYSVGYDKGKFFAFPQQIWEEAFRNTKERCFGRKLLEAKL